MNNFKFSIFLLALLMLSGGSCKSRKSRNSRTREVVASKQINSIAEEYKRLDKKCNEIELKLHPDSGNGELPLDETQGIRDQLRQMRLDVMNLQTELKSNVLKDRNFNEELLKTGLDVTIIDELARRIDGLTEAAAIGSRSKVAI